jgi:enolase
MKNLFLALLCAFSGFIFAQEKKTSTYNYGYNGMEYVVISTSETTIVSTFNSKYQIKDEIAANVYSKLKETNFSTGDTITVVANNATVTGKCYIQKRGKLTSVNFYYEKVEWDNGLVEIYKKV